jgi:hypothetical protein
MLTIHFAERSEGLLSVSAEAIGLSHRPKDQSPVRGARRENNDVRNGIPERKVPVIGNLSLPILFHPSFLSPLYRANVRLQERRSIVPWHPWENRMRERALRDSRNEKGLPPGSDRNLICEKNKHDEKEELVWFYSRWRHNGDTTKSLSADFSSGIILISHPLSPSSRRFSLYDL